MSVKSVWRSKCCPVVHLKITYADSNFSIYAGQVISAGWDKKVKFWDPRSTSSLGCLSSLGMEVESMSLSGLSLMIAHKSSVHLYDLRRLDKSLEAKEYFMDIHINCVRANSELEGIPTVVMFQSLVEIQTYQYFLAT